MAVSDKAFLDLEESLTKELEPRLDRIQSRIVPQLAKAIRVHDMAKVADVLDSINISLLYKGKLKKITLLFKTGLLFGASRITSTAKALNIASQEDTMAIADIAKDQYVLQINEIGRTLRNRYMQLATQLEQRVTWEETRTHDETYRKEEVEVEKAFNPINLPDVLNNKGAKIGKGMVRIASSLQMSRMAAYGFAAEAHSRGIITYRINEVLDSRTCPVCKAMDGKEFEVTRALAKLDTLVRIKDPNDLKLLAPFPKQDAESVKRLDSLSREELHSQGFDTPPFHPMCRGLLAKSLKADNLAPARVDPLATEVDINPRVSEFLSSAAAQLLTTEQREFLVAAAAGVTDYSLLPKAAKDLIEQAGPAQII